VLHAVAVPLALASRRRRAYDRGVASRRTAQPQVRPPTARANAPRKATPKAQRDASAKGPRATAPRRPVDRLFHRAELLRAAAHVFHDRGTATATVEDILRESGVSRRTFYKFFDGKEGVMLALYEAAMDLLTHDVRRAVEDSTDFHAQIDGAVGAFSDFMGAAGRLVHVMGAEALRPDSKLWVKRQAALDRLVRLFVERAEQQRGVRLKPHVFYGVLAALEAVAKRLYEGERSPTEQDRHDARLAMKRIAMAVLAGPDDPVPPLLELAER
jgi:AcrR family transcriptional regulator